MASNQREPYPEVEPYECGYLRVSGSDEIYWEQCGNPSGTPALVLHGGPGSGCSEGMRRLFDPDNYRVVLFDQRNAGRSLPHASDPWVDLSANTTWNLLEDIEQLRKHLDIDSFVLFGMSWGSTLGLAYAEKFPSRVSAMVLAGVTTTRPSEIAWLYSGVAPLFPQAWERFRAGVPMAKRAGSLVDAYNDLLNSTDPDVRAKAARNWSDWEWALTSIDPEADPGDRWVDPVYQLGRARVVTHYFRNAAWLDDGLLIRHAHRLDGIPGVLVQGRLDLQAPLKTAWELQQNWHSAEMRIVNDAGHSQADPGMLDAILDGLDKFAHSQQPVRYPR